MNNFIYYTPTEVYFGKKQEEHLNEILNKYHYKKILFHYGMSSIKKTGLYDKVINQLKLSKIDYVELPGVSPNPKLSLVLKGVEICKKENVDLILAVGGGSVIDSAKSIAVGAKVDFNPWLFSIKEKTPQDHIPYNKIRYPAKTEYPCTRIAASPFCHNESRTYLHSRSIPDSLRNSRYYDAYTRKIYKSW